MKVRFVFILLLILIIALLFTNINQTFSQQTNKVNTGKEWEGIGPAGGWIRQLIVAPSNRDIIYAIVEGGNVFRSTNKGTDWELINSFPGKCYIISINSLDHNNLFAVSNMMGLIKTTDGGKNWNQTGWNSSSVNCLAIDPTNSNIMYLATNEAGGIYKSVDGGNSWIFSSFQEDLGIPQVIKIDPQHNNIVYVLSWKLYRSTDYGVTWVMLLQINGTFTNFDIDPNNSNRIFVSSSEGIYKSNNSGDTFSIANGGDIDVQHPWTEFVLVNPYNSNRVYRSTNSMAFISTDSGNIWRSTTIPAISFIMPTNNVLLSGADGIYSSDENCNNVKYSSDGLNGTIIKSITSDPINSSKLFALTGGNLFITNSKQLRWEKSSWEQGSVLNIHPENGQIIFGGFDWGKKGINKSTNGGDAWYPINIDDYIKSFAFDPVDSNIIFAGGMSGVYRSDDLGEKWQKISIFNNNPLDYSEFKHISIGNDNKTIFIASSSGFDWSYRYALLKTNDYGQTWTECNLRANSVLVLPDDPNIILGGQSTHIYRSTDSGDNWEIVHSGFTNVSINNFQLINNNCITVGTSDGVYFSSDKGKTWFDISEGLGNRNIQCLSFSKSPIPTLFAGTYGGGIYRKIIDNILSVEPNKDIIQEYRLFNNYPNPFNPNTTIRYSIPVETLHATSLQYVTLKIYDILGREISSLVNEEKAPGNYEVKFDGSNLSSGVYFYRLQAGTFSETKKFVLMK